MDSPLPSARTLLANLIDYAGLFPPASLSMQAMVETFARAVRGEHHWVPGRLICPASRLDELSAAAAPLMPGTFATSGYRDAGAIAEPWGVSVLADGPVERVLEQAAAFNARHNREDAGLAVADAIEFKAATPDQIEHFLEAVPDDFLPFIEIPLSGDCRGLVAALAGESAGAKIRTGGVTPDLIPSSESVAAFLHAAAAAEVPFKATAGLHHAVRGEYPLTYAKDSPRALMHGFLNLFVAAALVSDGQIDLARTVEVLDDRIAASFRFSEGAVAWRQDTVDVVQLAKARETFSLSFGSCSFDEPVDELSKLSVL